MYQTEEITKFTRVVKVNAENISILQALVALGHHEKKSDVVRVLN
jgi:hypothetical protein